MMRVGLAIYGGLDTLSGGYLYDRKLVEYLEMRGDGVEVISLPRRNYPLHLADNLSRRLLERLAGLRVDVLLQDELNHPSLFALNRRIKKKARFPIVSIVHHLRCCEGRPALQNMLYRHVERRYLAGIDGFIYNSETTRRAVEGVLDRSPPHVVARPCGDRLRSRITDEEIARRMQDDTLRILFVGNLIPRKGLHTLLNALEALRGERWTLTVAGSPRVDAPYARRIFNMAAGLGGRVLFTGALGDAGLAGLMRKSHVLAMPSVYEGYGIAYIEGMGFGLPAIGTTAGAAREIITDGRDGFLAPPGDAKALARRLSELMFDRRRLLEMGLAARARYLAHPTWEESMGRARDFLIGLRSREDGGP